VVVWQERYDVSENAIPLLERLRTRDVSARPQLRANEALSYCRRDIPLAERTAAATRIRMGRFGHGAIIAELRELISFVSSLPPRRPR